MMRNDMINLHKKFIEEKGLKEEFEKWKKKREVSAVAVEFKLGKRLDRTQIEEGKYYYTGEIDKGGPKAWHYYSSNLFCGAEFMSPACAKDFYEISEEEFEKYLDGYNEKKYGKDWCK